jgi:hypothetical protein
LKAHPYPDCSSEQAKTFETFRKFSLTSRIQKCSDDLLKEVPAVYTNFEVIRLSFLRSREYMRWFKALDESGGFYLHRWGDAPVRFLAMAMHLSVEKILQVPLVFMHVGKM